jgi:transposase-like protein
MIVRPPFSQEFKAEAGQLVKRRDVIAAPAVHDLGVHENILRS